MLASLTMCVVTPATCQEYLVLTAECIEEKALCRHCHSEEIHHTVTSSTVILQTMNSAVWKVNIE